MITLCLNLPMQKLAPPSFGTRVRSRREELGLTRPQLLDVVEGLSLSTLINIELRDQLPRAQTLARLAKALDLSVDDLLAGAA